MKNYCSEIVSFLAKFKNCRTAPLAKLTKIRIRCYNLFSKKEKKVHLLKLWLWQNITLIFDIFYDTADGNLSWNFWSLSHACLISSWDEIWDLSQNEMRDMSHVTRFVVCHKYSFGMIEHLLTKNMRYIDK